VAWTLPSHQEDSSLRPCSQNGVVTYMTLIPFVSFVASFASQHCTNIHKCSCPLNLRDLEASWQHPTSKPNVTTVDIKKSTSSSGKPSNVTIKSNDNRRINYVYWPQTSFGIKKLARTIELVEVEVKVTLRLTISRPVRLGVRRPSGTRGQFFILLEIFF
jgi:hypothetical protein